MAEWIPIGPGGFIKADVIRWKEWVYKSRRSRRKRSKRLGERLVSAEVLSEPDKKGWVQLLVRQCEIISELAIKRPWPIPSGTEIRRAEKTILRGNPERLLWSDETARDIVASRFLGNRDSD